ncbi:hypothetical protein LTR53_003962 [Teratosphaeriaceae sp. CCFEE 6253]|nr:hypothetical protein LTR53_003962 [Teratosphaeriaceae sp. CCFEE 6253]
MTITLPRTLPASWYTSTALCSLERRAVFLKAWYLLGPVIKFAAGQPVSYEFSGVELTAAGDPDNQRSVHVVNSNGQPLRSHVTRTGLVFTTITAAAPTFDVFFPGLEDVLAKVDFTARPYRRSIKYHGHFNWKAMIDGVLYPPTFYAVENHHNWSQHFADPTKPDDGLFLYFLPGCTLNVYGGGMSLFRVCPTLDPSTTRMEFDYFNVDDGEKFEEYYAFVQQVALEDYELCENAQYNLERGIYAEGVLNPVKENGVACECPRTTPWRHMQAYRLITSPDYQQRVLEMVLEQHQEDRQAARHGKTARLSVD